MKEGIKKVALDILQNNFIFFIGVILLVYKGLLINNLIGLGTNINTILYTILVALLIMCPTINHKNKFGYIYLNVVYLLVTIIIYADFLYYSYSTNSYLFIKLKI